MSSIWSEGFIFDIRYFLLLTLQYQTQSHFDTDFDEKARYQDLHLCQLLKHQ